VSHKKIEAKRGILNRIVDQETSYMQKGFWGWIKKWRSSTVPHRL